MLKYESSSVPRDKLKRIYAETFWHCRTDYRNIRCFGVDTCIKMYPNLKCHKNER